MESNETKVFKSPKGNIILVWYTTVGEPCYCISLKSGGWLTGFYDSVESALVGADFDMDCMQSFYTMQKEVNHFDQGNRPITMEDLKKLL